MRRKELEFNMIGRALTPYGKNKDGEREMLSYFSGPADDSDDKKNK